MNRNKIQGAGRGILREAVGSQELSFFRIKGNKNPPHKMGGWRVVLLETRAWQAFI